MGRRLFSVLLLIAVAISIASCDSPSIPGSAAPTLADAGFRLIDLVLNYDDVFVVAKDSILIASDAISLVQTIPANQSPSASTKAGHVHLSILYVKKGVNSQDVYDINAGKAHLGILFQGGTTFEAFSATDIQIDATQTKQITIVPLQNATSKVVVTANKGWQNTGIFLERGKQYTIKYASGVWSIAKGSVNTSDAAGQPPNPPKNLICNCSEPLPGFSTQGLVGRIGQGLNYAPLQVGDDFAGVSYANDFLYLRINLADQLLRYASGSVTVTVQTDNG